MTQTGALLPFSLVRNIFQVQVSGFLVFLRENMIFSIALTTTLIPSGVVAATQILLIKNIGLLLPKSELRSGLRLYRGALKASISTSSILFFLYEILLGIFFSRFNRFNSEQ